MSKDSSSGGEMKRRDFNKLLSAAVAGMFAGGALSGCKTSGGTSDMAAVEPHACRGLNSCKGQGAGGGNGCAGQGECATVEHHSCAGSNKCKNQGGCGATPGENECSGKGKCAIPLKDHAWGKARANFEKKMKAAGKPFGEAPPKKA